MREKRKGIIKIKNLNYPSEEEFALWNSFSSQHQNGNFFQSEKAFKLFQETQNYSPFVLLGFIETELVSVLSGVEMAEKGIKSLFSNRIIIWGGPLVKGGCKELTEEMLIYLSNISNRTVYTEFRNLNDLSNFKNEFQRNGFIYREHLNFIVSISTPVEQKRKLSKSKNRQINSSFKNGASIEEPTNVEEVKQFYLIIKELYQKKIKKPLPPLNFFVTFFLQKDIGKIFLIKYKGKVVGGIVCPIFQNKIIYEWYIAGIDGKFRGIYPSILATWAPIQYALQNNIKSFDFLGAGSPKTDYGVREFKSKFGGIQVEYGRFLKINKPLVYSIGKLALVFFLRLKK